MECANRVQLTTDGHKAYRDAVNSAFANATDYAMLVKLYEPAIEREVRYSPPVCIWARRTVVHGAPNPKHISTSYLERRNLTIRMQNRRFTRLTDAFIRKIENHKHALAIFLMFYNVARIHQTLGVRPAMEVHVSDHAGTMEEVAALSDPDSE